jgi:hypothetical protein
LPSAADIGKDRPGLLSVTGTDPMPRKPAKTPDPAGRMRSPRFILAVLVTLVAVAGVLFGLGYLGDAARDRLGPRDRYLVRFADVECDVPPGHGRESFLAEVRYVGNAPESFQLLDPDLGPELSTAFAAHPWVEGVDGVDPQPPNRVRVRLRFRTAVLAVRLEGGGVRLVDANAVLLPGPGEGQGLAELVTPVKEPPSPAGQVWVDDTVKRAVELVRVYQPRRLEKTPAGWRLTGADGKTLHVAG